MLKFENNKLSNIDIFPNIFFFSVFPLFDIRIDDYICLMENSTTHISRTFYIGNKKAINYCKL